MAKKSAVEKNNRRKRMVAQKGGRRAALRAIARDKSLPMEERFQAVLKLSEEPRDSARPGFATVARYRVVRAVTTANSECRASHSAIWPRWARFLVL